ncbi:thioredoxin family protein [bacterium]|nr:thioredoxin family protein [bacterium]
MALTPSTMLALGTEAPDFSLPDATTNETVTLASARGEHGLLVMFICSHCPFVVHIQDELAKLGREFRNHGLGMVAICANDASAHPADAPAGLAKQAREFGFRFPYLYDETQEVAKAYTAACTPDFFLFGSDLALVYRGQLDGSRPNNGIPVTGIDLRVAVDALLEDRGIYPNQSPSAGCNIKWRPGNEPDYAKP